MTNEVNDSGNGGIKKKPEINPASFGAQRLDDTELVDVEERALEDIPQMVADGAITHALVVCAFFHAANGAAPR